MLELMLRVESPGKNTFPRTTLSGPTPDQRPACLRAELPNRPPAGPRPKISNNGGRDPDFEPKMTVLASR